MLQLHSLDTWEMGTSKQIIAISNYTIRVLQLRLITFEHSEEIRRSVTQVVHGVPACRRAGLPTF